VKYVGNPWGPRGKIKAGGPRGCLFFAPEKGINHVEALLAFKPLEMPQLKRLKDEK
jgi:hypothetical protein